MEEIIQILMEACREISFCIRNGDPEQLGKYIPKHNLTGDHVKVLDQASHEIIAKRLLKCHAVAGIVSEENDDVLFVDEQSKKVGHTSHFSQINLHTDGTDETKGTANNKYIVCFDPLDGSSNIDVNITTGTIFGMHPFNTKTKEIGKICGAGYALYGGATEFVYALHATNNTKFEIYKLHDQKQKWTLVRRNPKIPEQGKIYSVNESNKHIYADKRITPFIESCIENGYTARWVASMVADAHRTLVKGGFFAYPANAKNPKGRIRLTYEAMPFAFLFEQAGGFSSDGDQSILDIAFPRYDIHKKTPIILSGKNEFNNFCKFEK